MKIKEIFIAVKKKTGKISLAKKLAIGLFIVLVIFFGVFRYLKTKNKEVVQYETVKAEKGILISSVSASGLITSGNSVSVTTKAAGEVKAVYVVNGDYVTKGQKIAEVALDEYAAERAVTAWKNYLDAQEAVKTAEKNKWDADIAMWEARDAIFDSLDEIEDKNDNLSNPDTHKDYTDSERVIVDKTLDQTREAFEEAELKYKNADSEIQAAKAKVGSAWRDYQENSSTIYASTDGIISDLALAPGLVINASSSTSSSTGATIISSQTLAKICSAGGQLIATVNLAEIDVVKVKANQKASLTLDAYEDKTFTGKVLAVNTDGSVSSGVTSYPVLILLDAVEVDLYTNMAVNAEIIVNVETDVILIPTTAISLVNDQPTVQVKKDGQIISTAVETGSANDFQTAILSGINEGDEVIVSIIASDSQDKAGNQSISPFSGFGVKTSGSSGRSMGVSVGGPPPGGL